MHKLVPAAVMLLLGACAATAAAQSYPAKTVRIVVPFPPVGAADLLARTLGQKLYESLGQQFIVDNRPGAGGNIGAELVAAATPDGYLLIMAPVSTFAVGMAAYSKLNWHLEKNLVPIILCGNIPHMLVVHPALPVKNVKDIIALAKARPGELNFASQGNGTLSHLEQEMLKQLGGFTANHIPYKGSAPGLVALIGGETMIGFTDMLITVPHVKSGKLRALAVTGSQRSGLMPELPTIAESGLPRYAVMAWFGLLAPSATPPDIIARISAEIVKGFRTAQMQERFAAMGADPVGNAPEHFAAFLKAEMAKWAKLVKTAGIRAE